MRAHIFTRLFALLLLTTIGACTMCDKKEAETGIPKSMEGRVLTGTVTFGSGAFANMEGYSFTISFAKNRTFKTISSDNAQDSQGEYTYKRIDESTARLTLTDKSQLHEDKQIEVILTFASPKEGTFNGRFLSGETGEENGTFELE